MVLSHCRYILSITIRMQFFLSHCVSVFRGVMSRAPLLQSSAPRRRRRGLGPGPAFTSESPPLPGFCDLTPRAGFGCADSFQVASERATAYRRACCTKVCGAEDTWLRVHVPVATLLLRVSQRAGSCLVEGRGGGA